MKILQGMWTTFKEKKFELLFDSIAMVAGILIAFKLDGCAKQKEMNDNTIAMMGIMYLELQYNITDANEIYITYSDTNSITVQVNRLDNSAARLVLQDENIFNVLTHSQVSLILSYIDALNTVNQMNEEYLEHLDTVGYRTTANGQIIRTELRENTASFLAVSHVFEQEFKKFLDKKSDEIRKIKELETKIKTNKQKILDGNFKFTKK